jgi:hypothetical protein
LLSLFVQVFEFPEMFHPRLFLGSHFQFFLDCFGDELAQGDTALRGRGLGAAEQEIGDFESRLHRPILPYLWVRHAVGPQRLKPVILWIVAARLKPRPFKAGSDRGDFKGGGQECPPYTVVPDGSVGLRVRSTTGFGDGEVVAVVVIGFAIEVGVGAGNDFVVLRAGRRGNAGRDQRLFSGVHRFVQQAVGGSGRGGKDSEGHAVGIGDADVIGDHGTVIRNRQPTELHGSGEKEAGAPGGAAVQRTAESDFEFTGAAGAI